MLESKALAMFPEEKICYNMKYSGIAGSGIEPADRSCFTLMQCNHILIKNRWIK
jgi:hypothetical protein